jgi:hypothetical protein
MSDFPEVAIEQPMSEVKGQVLAQQTKPSEPPSVVVWGLGEARTLPERQRADLDQELEAESFQMLELRQQRAEAERQLELARRLETQVCTLTQDLRDLKARESQLIAAGQQREAELLQSLQEVTDRLNRICSRRSVRWLSAASHRFGGHDARDEIAAVFQQLRDDSLLFYGALRGFRLQPGPDLQRRPFIAYPLALKRAGLCAILLAPVLEAPLSTGRLGIEIASWDGKRILAQGGVRAQELTESAPVRFDFDVIDGPERGRLWLRVLARDVNAPLRVFEWCSYTPLGLGPRRARAFCGFIFAS